MKVKSLLNTNPYLKNIKLREKLFERSVISSSAIEGVRVVFQRQSKQKTPLRGK